MGPWPQMPTLVPVRLAVSISIFNMRFHGRVPFIVEVAHQRAIAVQTEGELGEVVAADGEAIDVLAELLGHDDVAR